MNNQFKACNHCGTKCDINDKFCNVCFRTLPETEFEPVIEGIEDVELIDYIGKKSDYYLERFVQKKGKWFIQWNWAAMLFGPTWFFYRKMDTTSFDRRSTSFRAKREHHCPLADKKRCCDKAQMKWACAQ